MLPGDFLTLNRGSKPAIIFDDETYSYADLDALSNRFANFFISTGLAIGDRVSLLMGNDPLMVAAYFGAFRAGVVANPLNIRLTATELVYILEHAQSRCVVTTGDFNDVLAQILPQLSTRPTVLCLRAATQGRVPTALQDALMKQPAFLVDIREVSKDDGALLIYTSGTTGRPKGALLTNGNVVAGAAAVREGFEIKAEDRTLCVMPLFHTNALMFSHMPFLLAGGAVVLRPRFSASKHWDICRANAVNSFSASPTILALLLEHQSSAPPAKSIHLDYVKVASAPTPVELAERFEDRFGKGLLLETYGLTETTAINTMNPLAGPRKFGSIGKALAPQEVAVVDAEGRPLAAGIVGELVVKGPTVMKQYFRDPGNTEKTIRNGWLYTGDMARMDDDGYFFIVGRKKEMIIRGGENISPLEVEQVLAKHPAVREAAAIGIPDRMWGEIVGVCAVLRSPATEQELIDFCSSQISAYKVPERVVFVPDLPRNAVGKVTRKALLGAFQAK